jgi:Mechanosensitive ion channel
MSIAAWRHRLAVAAVLACASTVARPGRAQDARPAPAAPTVVQTGPATVRLDGRPLFRVGGSDTLGALARAERTERRLQLLVTAPDPPPRARVREAAAFLLPRAIAAALLLLLTWGVAAGVRRCVRFVSHRVVRDRMVEQLVRQIAFFGVWTLGIALALDALGVPLQAFVTGFGLTSLALGFALKDIISNFVSGTLLLAGFRVPRPGQREVHLTGDGRRDANGAGEPVLTRAQSPAPS